MKPKKHLLPMLCHGAFLLAQMPVGAQAASAPIDRPPSLRELAFPGATPPRAARPATAQDIPVSPLYARTAGNPNRVWVTFSAAVAPATATNAANYRVTPARAVTRVEPGPDPFTVVLTTQSLDEDTLHQVVVNHVQDLATPANTVPADATVPILQAQGVLGRKVFTGLSGSGLGALTNLPAFPDQPTRTEWLAAAEAPGNQGDAYGQQLLGYLWPPITGDYQFQIAADDQGQLLLGTDALASHKAVVASVPAPTGSRQWNLYPQQRSEYIHLEAGRRYYLEVLMSESTGNDHLAVTWRLRGMPTAVDGDAPIPGAFLSSFRPAAAVGLSRQPQAQTVDEGSAATFTVEASGTPPYAYQWLRGGQPIPGANESTLVLPAVAVADEGALYSVTVSNPVSTATSQSAVLHVRADQTPPRLLAVSGSATLSQVRLSFSEPLDTLAAEDPSHYSMGGQLTVQGAVLLPDRTNVVLTTSLQSSGQAYPLTVQGVTDAAAARNPLTTNLTFSAWVRTRGFVHADTFPGIGGTAISDLTASATFPDGFGTSTVLPGLERASFADNYGQRLSAWLTPPTTGFYRFYVASDDQGAVRLSPDADPAHAVQVAFAASAVGWRNYLAQPGQRSAPVWLESGRSYYLEALQKEGGGDDYVNVAWQMPGQPEPVVGAPPIPSAYLSTAADPTGTSLTVGSPTNAVVAESGTATFAVQVAASSTLVFHQWQRDGVDIPGANAATYTTPRVARGDSGARYACQVSSPGITRLSTEAVLTVTPDTVAPQVTSAATLAGTGRIDVCFSERMDLVTLTNLANYTPNRGARVLRTTARPDGRGVTLEVAGLAFADDTLRLDNLRDASGNALPNGTTTPVAWIPMETTDLGVPGDPIEPGSTVACAAGAFDVAAGGGDFWGTADRGHYVFESVDGDFDASVRVESFEGANTYSRAGLMIREGLAAGSRMANVTLFPATGANRYEAHYRGATDAGVGGWPGAYQFGFPGVGVPLPNAWIRLTRVGDVFTAFASTNGTTWTQFSQLTFALPARLFLGVATSAQNNAAGALARVAYRDFHGPSSANPPAPLDLAVKRSTDPDTAYAGNDVYRVAVDTVQSLAQPAAPGQPAAFRVRIQNDGVIPQDAVVSAVEATGAGWTLACRLDGTDVTPAITSAGGHALGSMAPGSARFLEVQLLPDARVLGAARKDVTIRLGTPARTQSTRDVVLVEAINRVEYQPDLQVRRSQDVLYAGGDVHNLTGAGQTQSIATSPCREARFDFRLVNAGNVTNTFAVTATGLGAGWEARYFEGLAGFQEVTEAMVGTGVFVTLSPGAAWEGHAQFLPLAETGLDESRTVRITARSTSDPDQADAIGLTATRAAVTTVPQAGVFTTDADFAQGDFVGTVAEGNRLSLTQQTVTHPFIWVPNSNEGTVSKVDTRSGRELARYRVCPPNVTGNPSRTTIDQYGNCWVANRQTGTVVKIGLLEAGAFVDRNGNGTADTSRDLNGDGDITGAELLPWGQDECVLFEVVLVPGKEGVFQPGTYAGGYANDYWNPGPRGLAIDFDGNLWCGTWGTMKYYQIDGPSGQIRNTLDVSKPVEHHPYGAVIDSHGHLWSSGYHDNMALNNVLFLDPSNLWTTNLNLGHRTYGIGIDHHDHLFVAGYDSSVLTRIHVTDFQRDFTVPAPYQSRGVVVTDDDDVWTANSGPGTVTRHSNLGAIKATLPVGAVPTGVSVDADGKVWVVNDGDEYIKRIDPRTDTVDLSKRIVGGVHYGYSDMTGSIARNTTSRFGTWTTIHDARVELTEWGTVAWHDEDPSGSGVRVRVRSANRCDVWSAWVSATNGVALSAVPPGRYLQIEVALTARVGDVAPSLLDLTVSPAPRRQTDVAVTLGTSVGPWVNDHALTWTISGTNQGPLEARGVVLSNTFPGIELVSVVSSTGIVYAVPGGIRCDVGTLGAHAAFQLTLSGRLAAVGTVTNSVGLSQYEVDPVPANNLSTARLAVAANPCLPPPEGLVGWWPGDGDAADVVGTASGTLVGGAGFAEGQVGQAFSLNGTGAYVDLGRVSPGVRWSLEAWVNLQAVGSGRRVVIGTHADCRDWSLLSNEGRWGLNIGRGGCVAIIDSGVVAVPGIWYHLMGTCDGTNATIYVDGVKKKTEAVDLNYVGSSSGLRIGGSVCCGEYLSGRVDEPALYNRALTEAEVFACYDSLRSGKCRVTTPPTLLLGVLSATQLRLSWPSATSGFHVESAVTLDGPWQATSDVPVVVGDAWTLSVTPGTGSRFYRLRR